ncbi:hypothetical protein CPB86DRAFT_790004 [Serendipita vermifera]|nr:hypothetical protein CPB86DRAFT_790004 [Serendipita vermifera]
MLTNGKKKKRPSAEVLDGVILVAKVTKDIGETLPVLAPLKGAMGVLITILENAKKSKTNADDWEILATEIKGRLESIQDALKDKTPSSPLQALVTRYSKSLEDILGELNPRADAKKGSIGSILGFLAANAETERINDVKRKMGDAYSRFAVELNILTQTNVEDVQEGQKDLHQSIASNHAQTLQEHHNTRKQIDEIEVVNLLKGVSTAYLANGGIHKRCMKETRHSVLEKIETWRSDPDTTQILWLADVAGAGKSTVAKRWLRSGRQMEFWRVDSSSHEMRRKLVLQSSSSALLHNRDSPI